MIITPSGERARWGWGDFREDGWNRFDVFSLEWKQAERQTLRYSDDEEHFPNSWGGRETRDRGANDRSPSPFTL